MESERARHASGITRRETIQRGLALGAALTADAGLRRPTLAQSPPTGSPVATAYARPEALIDATTLMERRGDPALVPIALKPADEFAAGHIPGSVQVDWPALEITDTSDASVARWREEMVRLFGSLGVVSGSTVVTYDGGSLFATRPWWMLHLLGHDTQHVLNGGLSAWRAVCGEVATGTAATPGATPVATPAATLGPNEARPEALAQLSEVQASLDDPSVVLLDARTPEEYAQGHIPGAVNVNYSRNAQPAPPHGWLQQDELRALYDEAGVTPDKRVIPFCTTGVRSSVTFFTLHLIGYDNLGLYTGSWAEWSSHPELPVTTGSAP